MNLKLNKKSNDLLLRITPEAVKLLGLQSLADEFVEELAAVKGTVEKRIGAKDMLVEALFAEASRAMVSIAARAGRRKRSKAVPGNDA